MPSVSREHINAPIGPCPSFVDKIKVDFVAAFSIRHTPILYIGAPIDPLHFHRDIANSFEGQNYHGTTRLTLAWAKPSLG